MAQLAFGRTAAHHHNHCFPLLSLPITAAGRPLAGNKKAEAYSPLLPFDREMGLAPLPLARANADAPTPAKGGRIIHVCAQDGDVGSHAASIPMNGAHVNCVSLG